MIEGLISVHATNTTDTTGSWRILTRHDISWSSFLQIDKTIATVHPNFWTLKQFYWQPKQLGFIRTKVLPQPHRPDKIHCFAPLKPYKLFHLQELITILTLRCLQRHLQMTSLINFNPLSMICRMRNKKTRSFDLVLQLTLKPQPKALPKQLNKSMNLATWCSIFSTRLLAFPGTINNFAMTSLIKPKRLMTGYHQLKLSLQLPLHLQTLSRHLATYKDVLITSRSNSIPPLRLILVTNVNSL